VRRLDGTVTLITGASSGIGAELARVYARRGADLVLAARRVERLRALAEELEERRTGVLVAPCDVSRDGDLERVAGEARERFGRIDHVIANAGFGVAGRLERLAVEDYRRQLETNVFGVLRTVYATLDDLAAARGCLAILGSVSGYVALPGTSPYSMSKAAVHALARSLRFELVTRGISVTLVVPGFVDSEIRQVDNQGAHHPDAREPVPSWLRMPTDVAARKIVAAVTRRRRELVLTGHGRLAVALQRHTPGLLAFLISRFGVKGRREGG
jgi:short-subunit dehydrogenase